MSAVWRAEGTVKGKVTSAEVHPGEYSLLARTSTFVPSS